MSYANKPVMNLLRGPLLHTPQGWSAIAATVLYAFIAIAVMFGVVAPPLGKDLDSVLVICATWPLITFLIFVKHSLPDFLPSRGKAIFVCICAVTPIAYVAIYS